MTLTSAVTTASSVASSEANAGFAPTSLPSASTSSLLIDSNAKPLRSASWSILIRFQKSRAPVAIFCRSGHRSSRYARSSSCSFGAPSRASSGFAVAYASAIASFSTSGRSDLVASPNGSSAFRWCVTRLVDGVDRHQRTFAVDARILASSKIRFSLRLPPFVVVGKRRNDDSGPGRTHSAGTCRARRSDRTAS